MGGFGSGRIGGWGRSDAVESYRYIDVNTLHRQGYLMPGWSGPLRWADRDGEEVASISMKTLDLGCIEFSYRTRISGSEKQDITQQIYIVDVPCRYGGTRPYFRCPGDMKGSGACSRRVTKLYSAGPYFLCRHCYKLPYASQSENAWDRARRRAGKVRKRLDGDPHWDGPFPSRPKGMWRRTYDRVKAQAQATEEAMGHSFTDMCERLVGYEDTLNRRYRKNEIAKIKARPTVSNERSAMDRILRNLPTGHSLEADIENLTGLQSGRRIEAFMRENSRREIL